MVTREGSRYCNRQAAASYENSASTQHFTAECDEHGKTENPGEQACLDIRWGILSSATWEKSGLEFWLGFFFWIQKLLEHLKKIYHPKSLPGYEVDFSGNAIAFNRENDWRETTQCQVTHSSCVAMSWALSNTSGPCYLESHNY